LDQASADVFEVWVVGKTWNWDDNANYGGPNSACPLVSTHTYGECYNTFGMTGDALEYRAIDELAETPGWQSALAGSGFSENKPRLLGALHHSDHTISLFT